MPYYVEKDHIIGATIMWAIRMMPEIPVGLDVFAHSMMKNLPMAESETYNSIPELRRFLETNYAACPTTALWAGLAPSYFCEETQATGIDLYDLATHVAYQCASLVRPNIAEELKEALAHGSKELSGED